jgi:hypothetical protein
LLPFPPWDDLPTSSDEGDEETKTYFVLLRNLFICEYCHGSYCHLPTFAFHVTGRFLWNTLSPPDVLSLKRATGSDDSTRFEKSADEVWDDEFGGTAFAKKTRNERKAIRSEQRSDIQCIHCDKRQEESKYDVCKACQRNVNRLVYYCSV